MTFSATVNTGTSMKCLVHHADPCAQRVARSSEVDRGVVDDDLARVGLVQAEQDVHECALAGTVLPEEGVDLPFFDDQVDVVVRDERTEGLGDPSQFQLHVRSPSSAPTTCQRQ